MKHLDLFSGIGGFALAARWMAWETVQFVEIEPFCQAVLKKNFPNTPIHGDIKTFDGTKYRGTIDILTGGFPCQPFSIAGKTLGKNDARYLWPEMRRVIREVNAPVIVGENVAGIKRMELNEILADLENSNYITEVYNIPADSLLASHQRERIWIVAYSKCEGLQRYFELRKTFQSINRKEKPFISKRYVPTGRDKVCGFSKYIRNGDGVSRGVDRDRIKSIGNAIVPQIAFEIFKAIERINS